MGVAAAAFAQEPVWTWSELPGAKATAFAVVFDAGFVHDADGEHGLARALAECRLESARAAVPDTLGSGTQVTADATVAFVLVDAAKAASGLAFCRALVDDGLAPSDDVVRLAIARAALAADDAEHLFPGEMFECAARRALLAGPIARPVAGTASAVAAVDAVRLRERLREPVGFRGVGVGAVPADVRAAAAAWVARDVSPPRASERGTDRLRVAPPTPHARIDGPFAAAAFVAGDAGPELAVAVEVARQRAARRWRFRGKEWIAKAPAVSWSWTRGEPLVRFCRRGVEGADPAGAKGDIEALLADLRERPPSAAEVAAAVRALESECGASGSAEASLLPGRAIGAGLARRRGIDVATLAAVTPDGALRAARRTFAPDTGWWGSMVPTGVRPDSPW
ncbi:MAG: hypothetical protein JNK78_06830 [Planctomycetes bacterium]|nr:hypothetical protein [Planctomycetota bacterium]